jgi:hypothetical protein
MIRKRFLLAFVIMLAVAGPASAVWNRDIAPSCLDNIDPEYACLGVSPYPDGSGATWCQQQYSACHDSCSEDQSSAKLSCWQSTDPEDVIGRANCYAVVDTAAAACEQSCQSTWLTYCTNP